MSRIFISYKRVDKEKVFKIKDQIESALGEKCWIDLDGIESDAQFKNIIIKAIKNCEVFLFMYSQTHSIINDFAKDWTMRELNFAEKKEKRIVFINIDGTPLTDEFEFDFGTKQQIDARSNDAVCRLLRDLRRWLDIPEFTKSEVIEKDLPELKDVQIKQLENQSAVDMGLSVCWATLNIGATNIEDNGDYFAWGEIQTKELDQFTKSGYLLGKPTRWGMEISKYNDRDKIEKLQPDDDVATRLWGERWRMPTQEEFEELVKNCTIKEISHHGKDFYQFTSNINHHIICFPKNGYVKNGKLINSSGWLAQASLWTSTKMNLENEAHYCCIITKPNVLSEKRWCGCAIRPVKEK